MSKSKNQGLTIINQTDSRDSKGYRIQAVKNSINKVINVVNKSNKAREPHKATEKRSKQKENFSKSGCFIWSWCETTQTMRKGISNLSKAENKSLYYSKFLTKKENNMKFDDARKFKSALLTQQINWALTFFPTFNSDFGFNCE